jgi:hypothetical protein
MIDRRRLVQEFDTVPHPPQLTSLSYAIGLLGTTVSNQRTALEKTCYDCCINFLEAAERSDDDAHFNSLNLLQTYTLLTFYEFRRKSFARAWMNSGRAFRLAEMMRLHQMDRSNEVEASSKHATQLQDKFSLTEARERRRTFWVLFALDAYANIRIDSPLAIHEETVYFLISSTVHDMSYIID